MSKAHVMSHFEYWKSILIEIPKQLENENPSYYALRTVNDLSNIKLQVSFKFNCMAYVNINLFLSKTSPLGE